MPLLNMGSQGNGYSKFYLLQPISIVETVESIRQLDDGLINFTEWHEKTGTHSPSVPTFTWIARGGHRFTFQMGTQWENRNLSRSIGLFFHFMLLPKSL